MRRFIEMGVGDIILIAEQDAKHLKTTYFTIESVSEENDYLVFRGNCKHKYIEQINTVSVPWTKVNESKYDFQINDFAFGSFATTALSENTFSKYKYGNIR